MAVVQWCNKYPGIVPPGPEASLTPVKPQESLQFSFTAVQSAVWSEVQQPCKLDTELESLAIIAELQIKPKSKSNQTTNLERLYNCLASCFLSCFLVWHAENSSDVTLAFEDAD